MTSQPRYEEQHNEELMDEPGRGTESVRFRIGEPENRCGEKESRFKEIERREVLAALSDMVVGVTTEEGRVVLTR